MEEEVIVLLNKIKERVDDIKPFESDAASDNWDLKNEASMLLYLALHKLGEKQES